MNAPNIPSIKPPAPAPEHFRRCVVRATLPFRPRWGRMDQGLTKAEAGFVAAALVNVPLSEATATALPSEIEAASHCFVLDVTAGVDVAALVTKVSRMTPAARCSLVESVGRYYECDLNGLPHERALAESGLWTPPE